MDLLRHASGFVAIVFGAGQVAGHPLLSVYHCGASPSGQSGIQDLEGKLAAELGYGEGDVALLRPDGYLAGLWKLADLSGMYTMIGALECR